MVYACTPNLLSTPLYLIFMKYGGIQFGHKNIFPSWLSIFGLDTGLNINEAIHGHKIKVATCICHRRRVS